jgi:methionine-rich copper-binding protein CopC
MTPRSILAASAALAVALAAPALAHSELTQSTIADGSEIATAPESLSMTFSEPVALAGVALANAVGAELSVGFEASPAPAATFTVGLPPLAPGVYELTWRALGDDGHVMTDTIDFAVTGAAMDHGAAHGGAPDGSHEGHSGAGHDSR